MTFGTMIKRTVAACLAFFTLTLFLPTLTASAAEVTPPSDLLYGRSALATRTNGTKLVAAYDRIVSGMSTGNGVIELYGNGVRVKTSEVEAVIAAYFNDHGEHFWFDGSWSYTYRWDSYVVTLTLGVTSGCYDRRAEFGAAIDALYNEAALASGMTEYEKALRLYDVLISRVEYDDEAAQPGVVDPIAHNAFGAAVEGIAVCEGYAEAYQCLLYKAGIFCHRVTGTSNGGGHAWNIVRLDGTYAYVDATWDDDDALLPEERYHQYFGMSEARISADHTVDRSLYDLPACTSDAAWYFTRSALTLPASDSAYVAYIIDRLQNGVCASFYVEEGSVGSAWSRLLSDDGTIINAVGPGKTYQYRISYKGREAHVYLAYVKGDTDGDGFVTASDLTAAAGHVAHVTVLSNRAIHACNVNDDTIVSASDLTSIARYVAGISGTLG